MWTTRNIGLSETWTCRAFDGLSFLPTQLQVPTLPEDNNTQQHNTPDLPQTCCASSQAMISTLCDRSPHPLFSVTTQVADHTLTWLSRELFFIFTGFSPPTLSTHKLLLICSFHNIRFTIGLFSQNGFVYCPLEQVPKHHKEESR